MTCLNVPIANVIVNRCGNQEKKWRNLVRNKLYGHRRFQNFLAKFVCSRIINCSRRLLCICPENEMFEWKKKYLGTSDTSCTISANTKTSEQKQWVAEADEASDAFVHNFYVLLVIAGSQHALESAFGKCSLCLKFTPIDYILHSIEGSPYILPLMNNRYVAQAHRCGRCHL